MGQVRNQNMSNAAFAKALATGNIQSKMIGGFTKNDPQKIA